MAQVMPSDACRRPTPGSKRRRLAQARVAAAGPPPFGSLSYEEGSATGPVAEAADRMAKNIDRRFHPRARVSTGTRSSARPECSARRPSSCRQVGER